jgi:hypothetical protein
MWDALRALLSGSPTPTRSYEMNTGQKFGPGPLLNGIGPNSNNLYNQIHQQQQATKGAQEAVRRMYEQMQYSVGAYNTFSGMQAAVSANVPTPIDPVVEELWKAYGEDAEPNYSQVFASAFRSPITAHNSYMGSYGSATAWSNNP